MSHELQINQQVESYQSIKDTLGQYLVRVDRHSIKLRMRAQRAEELNFDHPTFKQFFEGWEWERDENGSFAPAEIVSEWVLVTLNFNSRMRNALKFIYPSINDL